MAWVEEEAARQVKAWFDEHTEGMFAEEFAESCLRAGLLEAARRLDVHKLNAYHEAAEGDSTCFAWMDRSNDARRYAAELRALADGRAEKETTRCSGGPSQ